MFFLENLKLSKMIIVATINYYKCTIWSLPGPLETNFTGTPR